MMSTQDTGPTTKANDAGCMPNAWLNAVAAVRRNGVIFRATVCIREVRARFL